MALERQLEFSRRDPTAVIGDDEDLIERTFDPHLDGTGAGIEGVLDDLFKGGQRAFDDLAGGDAGRRLGRESADRLGHGPSGWTRQDAGGPGGGQAVAGRRPGAGISARPTRRRLR